MSTKVNRPDINLEDYEGTILSLCRLSREERHHGAHVIATLEGRPRLALLLGGIWDGIELGPLDQGSVNQRIAAIIDNLDRAHTRMAGTKEAK